ARSPRERPHRTPGPRGRVSQQKCRSPEPDCPHRSSPPGTRETASSARDRPPQRSASSDPSANRGGIIQPESNNSVRFHTTKVISRQSVITGPVRFPPKSGHACVCYEGVNFEQPPVVGPEPSARAAASNHDGPAGDIEDDAGDPP